MRWICFLVIAAIGISCNGQAAPKPSQPKPQRRPAHVLVSNFVLSADGKRLLIHRTLAGAATEQMRIGFERLQLWDLNTVKKLRSFTEDLYTTTFLPDGDHAILGKETEVRGIWNVITGKKIHDLGGSAMQNTFLVSIDGKQALGLHNRDDSADILLWDLQTERRLRDLQS